MTITEYITTLPKDMKEKILKNVALQGKESKLEEKHFNHQYTISSLFIWRQTDDSLEGHGFWSDFATGRIQPKFTFSLI